MDHNCVAQNFDVTCRSRPQRAHDAVAMTHATPTDIQIQRESVVHYFGRDGQVEENRNFLLLCTYKRNMY